MSSISGTTLTPSNAGEPLEIDDNWDADSAVASLNSLADTIHTSLKSCVQDYYYENGRRYHSFRHGEYNMPNDDREQERLEYYHYCWTMLRGGRLFNAPIGDSPQRVLDLGTGTGSWAIDFADFYPSAIVIGNDLSPIQPSWVPPNCRFIVDDIASPWVYHPNEKFDFIHARMLNGSLSDWPRLYEQALEHLQPGGWFEVQEFDSYVLSDEDPLMKNCPNLKKYIKDVNGAAKAMGKDMDIASTVKAGLIEAGFEDVTEDIYDVPIGSWIRGKQSKLLGDLFLECISESLDAYGYTMMTRFLGKTADEAHEIVAQATKEFRDPSNRFHGRFRFIYGRKPKAVG